MVETSSMLLVHTGEMAKVTSVVLPIMSVHNDWNSLELG